MYRCEALRRPAPDRYRVGNRCDPDASVSRELSDGLIFDAIRIRLVEIGGAVEAIFPSLLATESHIPWKKHRRDARPVRASLLRAEHTISPATFRHDLAPLLNAVNRLQARLPE